MRHLALADLLLAVALSSLAGAGCKARTNRTNAGLATSTADARASDPRTLGPYAKLPKHLANRVAYVPAQCFTKTSETHDTCYTCHTAPEAPNYVDDSDLQLRLLLPEPAKKNPWTNVLVPPFATAPKDSDADVLSYVRTSNYFRADGSLAVAAALARLADAWDENGNGTWDGYVPDAYFAFDARGFDHAPDGSPTGWRAFAYYPFPGAFFPTNGSTDDVMIRLDPVLREDTNGQMNADIAALNLSIVEALITRHDVPIDGVDEAALGVDLDLDGKLGHATRVAFDVASDGDENGGTRMRYVGMGRDYGKSHFFPISPGLYPLGTEFLHTVRYVDLGADGTPRMAARMKEVRYAKKLRFEDYRTAKVHAKLETEEENESLDGTHEIAWEYERGVYNKRGWELQGFIEAKDGSLRPQTFEESAACAGCHGGVGATVDSTFAFGRKLSGIADQKIAPARGWFHWSQRDLRGIPEPRRIDGEYEYSYYLTAAGAGDELRENQEVLTRFFAGGTSTTPTPSALRELHGDISVLLLPSPARALDLDRAYLALVRAQSFDKGRDAVLTRSANVYDDVPVGASTGIEKARREVRLSSNCCRNVTESRPRGAVPSAP